MGWIPFCWLRFFRRIEEPLTDPLDPAVLFEQSTLEKLTSWLVRVHPNSLSIKFGLKGNSFVKVEKQTFSSFSKHTLQPLSRKPCQVKTVPADIVVIGMSCCFPGANNVEAYWELLSDGRSALFPVPEKRFKGSNLFYAGLLNNITDFDPSFFLIAKEDAKVMDPQALLVLEESLNVFYHAGYSLEEIKGASTGVYLGARSQNNPKRNSLEESRNPIRHL